MANYERLSNIRWGFTATLVAEFALFGLAGDALPSPEGAIPGQYVDCAKYPGAQVHAQFDAAKPRELFVGNMQTDAAGAPEHWRTAFDIDTVQHDLGEIGVASGGYGLVFPYGELPKDGAGTSGDALFLTVREGERLNMSQVPHPDASAHAPVLVTYTCATAK